MFPPTPPPKKIEKTTLDILEKEVDEKYFLSSKILKTILTMVLVVFIKNQRSTLK